MRILSVLLNSRSTDSRVKGDLNRLSCGHYFRGHVRVRGEEFDRTMASLQYDVRGGRFVAGRHARARGKPRTNVPEIALLEELNRLTARLEGPH